MASYYTGGTITISAGATLATGSGTAWAGADGGREGDLLLAWSGSAFGVAVLDADPTNTAMTLANAWRGPALTAQSTYLILHTGSAWHEVAELADAVAALIAALDAGASSIDNDSGVTGATVADALDTLDAAVTAALPLAGGTVTGRLTADLLNAGNATTLGTIATGVLAFTSTSMRVNTEGSAAADDLTTITGGSEGDLLFMRTVADTRDITLVNSASLLLGGRNYILTDTDDWILLRCLGSDIWHLVAFCDYDPLLYAAVSTNASYTHEPFTTAANIRHTGTLTADRTVTLSTTGAYAGQRIRFTRTGSGAYNLSIGGLKNLATNTWCDVVYDGSAWYLSAYGAL